MLVSLTDYMDVWTLLELSVCCRAFRKMVSNLRRWMVVDLYREGFKKIELNHLSSLVGKITAFGKTKQLVLSSKLEVHHRGLSLLEFPQIHQKGLQVLRKLECKARCWMSTPSDESIMIHSHFELPGQLLLMKNLTTLTFPILDNVRTTTDVSKYLESLPLLQTLDVKLTYVGSSPTVYRTVAAILSHKGLDSMRFSFCSGILSKQKWLNIVPEFRTLTSLALSYGTILPKTEPDMPLLVRLSLKRVTTDRMFLRSIGRCIRLRYLYLSMVEVYDRDVEIDSQALAWSLSRLRLQVYGYEPGLSVQSRILGMTTGVMESLGRMHDSLGVLWLPGGSCYDLRKVIPKLKKLRALVVDVGTMSLSEVIPLVRGLDRLRFLAADHDDDLPMPSPKIPFLSVACYGRVPSKKEIEALPVGTNLTVVVGGNGIWGKAMALNNTLAEPHQFNMRAAWRWKEVRRMMKRIEPCLSDILCFRR